MFPEDDSTAPHAAILSDRPAGYELMRASLVLHEQQLPQSGLARFFGVSPIDKENASWFTGALGEQVVGARLARLGPEWTVLHSVPVGAGDSDIDHIVIGPGGVFTINTKRSKDAKVWVGDRRILVAGQKTDHLRNSVFEAQRAQKLLASALGRPVMVTPLLVFVAISDMTVRSRPMDVVVLTEAKLFRWLTSRKPHLTPDEVAAIAQVAARGETWSTKPAAPLDALVPGAFAQLERADSAARTRRRLWGVAALAAMFLVVATWLIPAIEAALRSALPG